MARTVLTVVGYVVGAYFGYPELGAIVGGLVGGALEPNAHIEGTRLTDLKAPEASYGSVIPYIEGSWRTAGIFIWASDKRAIANESSDGGKGGPGVDTTFFTYEMDVLIELTINPMDAIRRVFSNGKLVWTSANDAEDGSVLASADTNSWKAIRFYSGDITQLPDPVYEAAVGIGNAPAYRGRATVFIEALNLGQSGQLPVLNFEVISSGGDAFLTEVGASLNSFNGIGGLQQSGSSTFDLQNGFNYYLQQWDAGYSGDTVLGFKFVDNGQSIQLPDADPSGLGFEVHSQFDTILIGSTDVDVFAQSRGNDAGPFVSGVRMYGNGTIIEWSFPGETEHITCFARKGANVVFGSNFFLERSLYKAGTGGGGVTGGYGPLPQAVQGLAISDDGFVYAMALNGVEVYKLDVATMTLVDTILTPNSPVFGTVLQPYCDGSTLYIISDSQLARLEGGVFVIVIPSIPTTAMNGVVEQQHFAVRNGVLITINAPVTGAHVIVHTVNVTLPTVTVGAVALSDVVSRLCVRTGRLTTADIDVSELAPDIVHGMALSQVAPTRQAIESLMAGYLFEAVEDGQRIKFIKRGGAEVLTIPYKDLRASATTDETAEPLPLQRLNDLELPARVTVKYSNVENDYQDGAESGDRLVTQSTSDQVVELPLVFGPADAKKIADINTMDLSVSLIGMGPISVSRRYSQLEPTDVVRVTAKDGSTFRGRIQKATVSLGVNTFELVLDDATIINSEASTDNNYTSSNLVQGKASTIQQLLDIPILRDADNDAGFYDQVKPSGTSAWGGTVIYSSDDDVTLTSEGSITAPAVFGGATTQLGDWTGPRVFDERNTVTVNIPSGTLSSASRDALLSDETINAFALGKHGRWEIAQFRTATMLSAGVYTLSGFLRGSRGTEWATGTHQAGDLFSVLNTSGIRRIPIETTMLGIQRFYRAVTVGRSIDTVSSAAFTDTGVGLKPFSPFDARVTRAPGTGDIAITVQRRTRFATRVIGPLGISVPLGEESEIFSTDIFSDNTYTTVKRTITSGVFIVGGETTLYTAAQQTADFGSTQTTIYFRVHQLSQAAGRGFPLQAAA